MNNTNCNVCTKPAELEIGKKKVPFCADCARKKFLVGGASVQGVVT